jgi:hypothetical protein
MTRRQRVLCALSREQPDRVPFYDLLSNFRLLSHYAGTRVTVQNAPELLPYAASRILDTTRVWMPEPPGRRVDERGFVYERREPFNEWVVEKPFHTVGQAASFVREEIGRLEAWRPPAPREREEDRRRRREWQRRYGDTVLPASTAGEALATAHITLGLDLFVLLEADEPTLVERWLGALHGQLLAELQADRESWRGLSPLAWIFADLAYRGSLIFSPAYLESHGVFRRVAELCELYHGEELKVIFHSDGYLLPMVPGLLGAGVDALAPLEISSGLSLGELKERYGRRVAFVGGIDLKTLRFGTVAEVRALVREALRVMAPGGGYVLGSDAEELDEELPLENVLAMYETALEQRG